jgi:hypothetical protein
MGLITGGLCFVAQGWGSVDSFNLFTVSFLLAALGPNCIRAYPGYVSGMALATGEWPSAGDFTGG